MGYFTLAVAALCAAEAIIKAVASRRRGGDAYMVVQAVRFAGATLLNLAVSLNQSPLSDLPPLHPVYPRLHISAGMAVVAVFVTLGAPFVLLVPRAFQAPRTVLRG